MKGGLYYHPDRIKAVSYPMLLDKTRYDSVSYFTRLIEEMVPEVINDLRGKVNAYDEAQKWFLKHQLSYREQPSEWHLVKVSEEDSTYSGYASLKKELLSWTEKYNLHSHNDLYQELGLTALYYYYEDIQEENRDKRKKNAIEYSRQFGVPSDIALDWYFSRLESNSRPNREKLSLSSALNMFELEIDDIELEASAGIKASDFNKDFFNTQFPFVFTPNRVDISLFGLNNYSFEEILDYDHRKTFMLKQSMNNEDMKSYEPRDWESGKGWDPRTETWKSFEDTIDTWFKSYKKMYKERTEQFMDKHGYVKGKEKRTQEHFKWLLHYQIQGWSLRQIAEYYIDAEFNEDTLYRGVKSAAEVLMLNLRLPIRNGKQQFDLS
ncbi:hypothetical protein [Paenibacillus radicis (ex Xue et al. 2023)]|uniref:Uncharacterized protein n=1 Tax=Paenibacillus radicis (ex Xue et al. 2023) TaxID=2972489 RepID=A0ABT1YNV6_9BACL|nr:hypothetical protein [Paenibacillus radicis (ex Xue et al. 2023)]MCR8634867.1 hypothetical protein [Paenibacillus radicis (ex Xue et al. 2023)]